MLNKTEIIGFLGRNPEVRYTPDGKAIANLAVATTEPYQDRESGTRKKHTEWHRIVLFGRRAEVAQTFLKQGSMIYVEGRLRTRKWSKGGEDRYTTEIVGTQLTLLDRRGSEPAAHTDGQSRASGSVHDSDEGGFPADLEDIPF